MSSPTSNPNSDTGLASNLGAGLCAIFTLVGGIIFYFIEKKDQFVRHWAVQAIFFGATAIIVSIVISVLTGILAAVHIGFLGGLLSFAWSIFCFVLWILGVLNAFQGKRWEYPIISEQCKKLFPKLLP